MGSSEKSSRITAGAGRAVLQAACRSTVELLEGRTLFATTVFQIDPTLSQVTLSGEAFSIDLEEQSGGSLSAKYEGSILADVDADSIRFLGGSSITALSKGNYDPGNAAANYAAEAEGPFGIDLGEVAIRGLMLDATSPELALTSGTSFTSSGVNFTVDAGDLAYDTEGAGSGTESLAGASGANVTKRLSSVSVSAEGVTTLTIPIDLSIEDSGAELRLRGKLVATSVGTGPIIDANGPDAAGRDYAGALVVGQATATAAADAGLTITDVDDTNLTGGKITLANRLDGTRETLSVTGASGILASYDNATGILTLTGTSSLANYQTVLRSLRYSNSDSSPTLGDRTITMVLNDGTDDGPAATSVINVRDPNVATLGAEAAKSVTFTDADGSVTTLALKGPGSTRLQFTGATEQKTTGKGITITGTAMTLAGIQITDPSLLSKLTIKATGGDAVVTIGSLTSNGSIGAVGGKAVNLAGSLSVTGRIAKADFRNVTGATITADSIGKMTVSGAMTDSSVTLDEPYTAVIPGILSFTVVGAMTNSTVSTPGNINTVKVGSMAGSEIYAGRAGTALFPATSADFGADPVTIKKVTVGVKAAASPTFDNSVIAAKVLGTVALNLVDTDNGGSLFGVTADSITSLTATNALGQPLKLKNLSEPATLTGTSENGFTFGNFQIRVV